MATIIRKPQQKQDTKYIAQMRQLTEQLKKINESIRAEAAKKESK